MPVRLVLAEGNLLVREGLQQLLSTAADLDVVCACADLDCLLETIEQRSRTSS
jgi:DNA-binding NarL/FixJ family response regulator